MMPSRAPPLSPAPPPPGSLAPQVIFNSRKEASADDNKKLMNMIRPSDAAAFIKDLNTTHFW